jgi:hypothetical protein
VAEVPPAAAAFTATKAVSAKLFTGATEVLGKSGTGILPVITGQHRQDLRLVEPTARRDADAT